MYCGIFKLHFQNNTSPAEGNGISRGWEGVLGKNPFWGSMNIHEYSGNIVKFGSVQFSY